MNELDLIRLEIDKCDDIISNTYARRLQLVDAVAKYKKENNIEILNNNREQAVLDAVSQKQTLYKEDIKNLYIYIMEYSRNKQNNSIMEYSRNKQNNSIK